MLQLLHQWCRQIAILLSLDAPAAPSMSMDLPRAISLTLDASAAPSMVPPRAILLWLDAPAAPSMDQPKAILLTCVRAISHTCVRSLLLRNVGKKPETAVDFLETLVVRPGGGVAEVTLRLGRCPLDCMMLEREGLLIVL